MTFGSRISWAGRPPPSATSRHSEISSGRRSATNFDRSFRWPMMGRFRCLGTRGRSVGRSNPSRCPFTIRGPSRVTATVTEPLFQQAGPLCGASRLSISEPDRSTKTSMDGVGLGLDVLIGPKEVRRVVARLDGCKARIVRSVGLAHPVLSFHAKPIHVHGAFGEGTHRLEELPRPGDMALGIRWIGPL